MFKLSLVLLLIAEIETRSETLSWA